MAYLTASGFFNIMSRHELVSQKICAPVCKKYKLSTTAFDILMFLGNNPELNTARDICNLQGIKTGIVSVTVEQLIGRKLLTRTQDPKDRRIQRLTPTPEAADILREGRAAQHSYEEQLAAGLSPEEQAEFIRLCRKLWSHMGKMAQEAK